MTTIKEIAKKSGFSSATVSRLLNNDPKLSVTAETKNKILRVANELGYWEANKKSNSNPVKLSIALLYRVNGDEHLQDEYFAFLKKAIEEVTQEENIELTTFTDIETLIKEASSYQGFLGVGTAELTYKNLKKLYAVLPNGVFIDINPAPKLFDSVQPNLALTIEDALDRLTQKGYKSVGFIGAESFNLDDVPQRDIREITFSEYVKMKCLVDTPVFVQGIVSVKNGYKLGKKVLQERKNNLPEAFIISSDTLSVGVLQAFNEADIKIPKDTAIISINNSDVAQYVSPPLSSYNIDQKEMSKIAVQDLIARIHDSARPKIHLTMNTELIIRKSFR